MLAGLPSKALGEDLSLPLPDSGGCGYITLTSALVCTEPSPLRPLFPLCQTSSAFLLEGPLSLALRFISIPGGTGDKEPICRCRRCKRCGFDPWVGRIPWRRAWQPTPIFLPGEFRGQRSLAGYSPEGHKESDTTEETSHTQDLPR